MPTSYTLFSPDEMIQLGKELAPISPIILLEGELGTGKTTFAKGFAEALGINPEIVQSPTYTYINIYDEKLLHLDMYRLESFQQMVEKGILDQMQQFSYLLIEWPKWIEQLALESYLHLQIKKS
ncbi:MAG: tRNA (adenosine(37)-N6)-threonylcarbamoyltransferase complex ATPase subunit type 1 TsaE [Candidatus Peribacteria bacterium]|jgi:tRNA threonylcarbamoyladenosine biosynthesis protein TsaE|nr:tRNA (adenosine(37)-N6)-threonylcarbamoyltransferase complex ATPase subunit type 1 TsaE [Candidatus Peribacteria bacterium]